MNQRELILITALILGWPIGAFAQPVEPSTPRTPEAQPSEGSLLPSPVIVLEDREVCGGSEATVALAVELGRRLPEADIELHRRDDAPMLEWFLLWRPHNETTCDLWIVRRGEGLGIEAVPFSDGDALRDVAAQVAWVIDSHGREWSSSATEVSRYLAGDYMNPFAPDGERRYRPEYDVARAPLEPTDSAEPGPLATDVAEVDTDELSDPDVAPAELWPEPIVGYEVPPNHYDSHPYPGSFSSLSASVEMASMLGQAILMGSLDIGLGRVGRFEVLAEVARVLTDLESQYRGNPALNEPNPMLKFTSGLLSGSYRQPLFFPEFALRAHIGVGGGQLVGQLEGTRQGSDRREHAFVGIVEVGFGVELTTAPFRLSIGSGYRLMTGDDRLLPDPDGMTGPYMGMTVGWMR